MSTRAQPQQKIVHQIRLRRGSAGPRVTFQNGTGLMKGRESLIVALDGRLVGFTDFDADGDIHTLFVDPKFSRRGGGERVV